MGVAVRSFMLAGFATSGETIEFLGKIARIFQSSGENNRSPLRKEDCEMDLIAKGPPGYAEASQ